MDILATLAKVKDAVHEQQPDAPRLGDFDNHLATVVMVVEHIFDEAARSAEGN